MGEERTLTTEYLEPVIAVDTAGNDPDAIPQHVIDRLAAFFLKKMWESMPEESRVN